MEMVTREFTRKGYVPVIYQGFTAEYLEPQALCLWFLCFVF